jgi:two-component system, NtrC family, sensor histidine kinase PilS
MRRMRTLSSGTLPEVRQMLSWAYLGRMSLGGAVFVAAAWVWRAATPGTTFAATIIFVACLVFTGASVVYTHMAGRQPSRRYLYLQVLFDVSLVASVVHITGGKDSAFSPLYVLAIFSAAVLLPITGGVLVGILASLLYLADVVWSAEHLDIGVVLQVALFATLALVTGYLGDRLRRTGATLGEVETELRLLRLDTDDILASIATGILTVNGDGRLVYINPTASELLGLPAQEWLGYPILDVLDRQAPGMGALLGGALVERRIVQRFESPGAIEGTVLGITTALMDRPEPERPSVTAIFQDITEGKRMEVLRRRAERLEAVAELSASLAHEIRNPLASIRSATEQLSQDGVEVADRTVLRDLVVRESERLSRLLTEFIDFARVQLRSTRRVALARLLRNAVDVVRTNPEASGRTIVLDGVGEDEPLAVNGDEDLLHRAVLNLVLNAAQWAGPGGRVRVSMEEVAAEDAPAPIPGETAVCIRVADSGPGIPDEDREHVFDPFFTLRPGGTGLGLPLVHRAAEAHGGIVVLEDRAAEGWGASFALYLPTLEASQRQPAPAPVGVPEEP